MSSLENSSRPSAARGAIARPSFWARNRDPLVFLMPASLLILVFFVWPVVGTLFFSMTNLSTANFGNPEFVGLANYQYVLTSRWMPRILGNTAFYVTTVLLVFNIGFGLLIAISTTFIPPKAAGVFRLIWLLPRITSPVVYALIWQGVLGPAPWGIISSLTGVSANWLTAYPWTVVILANGIIGASFGMLIFTSAIKAIPNEHYQAAAINGASTWTLVRKIILPQMRWPILFVTAYQSLALLSSFEYIFLLTNGGPGFYQTEVWSLWAFKEAFQSRVGSAQFGLGAAMAAILVVLALAVSTVLLFALRFKDLVVQPKIQVN